MRSTLNFWGPSDSGNGFSASVAILVFSFISIPPRMIFRVGQPSRSPSVVLDWARFGASPRKSLETEFRNQKSAYRSQHPNSESRNRNRELRTPIGGRPLRRRRELVLIYS